MTADPQHGQPVFVNNNFNTNTVVVGYRRHHHHPVGMMIFWVLVACYWWPILACIAMYGYLGLGLAWLMVPLLDRVSPREPVDGQPAVDSRAKIAESAERFGTWLGKASLLNRA